MMKKVDLQILKDLHVLSIPEYKNVVHMRRYCDGEENLFRDSDGFARSYHT
jgi:hypothetical protein